MAEVLEVEARIRGCRRIYLLTAEPGIFERLGYVACDRAEAPAALRASRLFTMQAKASVGAMMKHL
jgi:N-acetylglutamate synthase-like GNAT family acetyltransferase